jgi:hypothetical protein
MTDQQMWGWVNSQVASGKMTLEQSSPFIDMTLRPPAVEAALYGGNSTTAGASYNFINLSQQYIASDDPAAAKFFQPALDLMLKFQS